jgi:hypothetical protein
MNKYERSADISSQFIQGTAYFIIKSHKSIGKYSFSPGLLVFIIFN